MTPPSHDAAHAPANELELLLEQSAWVRALARRLTNDPHAAEDLVQETWIAALEHPKGSRSGAPLRAWLASVLRNVARQGRRGSERRIAREAFASADARGAAEPSAHDVVAGLALQQELARAVQALDEPYRSTLYQRFYEGLPPREIAKRAGLPVKTVKTRLERGLAQLRARLDREHGERGAWLAMLVPWLGRDHAAVIVLGGLLVQLKLALFLGAAVACVAAALFVRSELAPEAPRVDESTLASAPAELAQPETKATALARDAEPVERARAASPVSAAPASVAPIHVAERARGRVIDVRGALVADVDVRCRDRWAGEADPTHPWRTLARTDAAGEFDVEAADAGVLAEVDDDRRTTVIQSFVRREEDRPRPTIVVAPKNALGGLVLDAERKPVEGAKLSVEVDGFRRDLGEVLLDAMQKTWSAASDAEGRFALPDAPRMAGRLVVRSPLHRELSVLLPELPTPDLLLVLEPLEKPHVRITGTVVDPRGEPVADAWVVLGSRSTKSDAHGRFEFDATAVGQANLAEKDESGRWRVMDDRSEIRAAKRGFRPATHSLPPFAELEARASVDPIVLQLGGAPLTIRGTVVEEDGTPLVGAEVELATSTPFGTLPAGGDIYWRTSAEQVMAGGSGVPTALTDERGRFELVGLLDRSYDLHVSDPATLRHVSVADVRANEKELVVRLGGRKELRKLAGRVVGKRGGPVAGAAIVAGFQLPSGQPSFGVRTTSDADGRFALQAVATDAVGLQVSGDELFFVFWRPITADDDREHLELVVSRRCYVQIDASDRPDLATRAVPMNDRGESLQIMEFLDGGLAMPESIVMHDGKSEVVAVEEDTTQIVFYKGDEEVARKSVTVVPREKIVVRP